MNSKHKQRGYWNFGPSSSELCVIALLLMFVGGAIPYVLLPWLWGLIKPWIHAITG